MFTANLWPCTSVFLPLDTIGLPLTNFSYLRQACIACVSEVQNLHHVAAWQLRRPCPISLHLVQKQFSSFLFTGSGKYDTLGSSPLNTFKCSPGKICEISWVLFWSNCLWLRVHSEFFFFLGLLCHLGCSWLPAAPCT